MRVSELIAEPRADLEAQIAYMLDLRSRKHAVFIAGDCEVPPYPRHLYTARRKEGVLLSTRKDYAQRFAEADPLEEELMAELLDYPSSKWEVMRSGQVTALQIRDAQEHVVKDAIVSPLNGSYAAFACSFIPEGGRIVEIDPIAAMDRRRAL